MTTCGGPAPVRTRGVFCERGRASERVCSEPQTTIGACSVRCAMAGWDCALAMSQNHAAASPGTLLTLRTPGNHSVKFSLRRPQVSTIALICVSVRTQLTTRRHAVPCTSPG